MERLEKQLQVNNLPSGEALPICLGHVFNCAPVLISASALSYQVNDGPIVSLTVRDNGIDITENCEINLTAGTFSLGASSVGKITCDVIEEHESLVQIVQFIAARYGETVDLVNLTAFADASFLGYYASRAVNGSRVLTDLSASIGAFPRFSLTGKLQLMRLDLLGDSILTIDENDILEDGLRLQRVEPPSTAVKLSYRRNWSPQKEDAQAGAVTAANRELYSQEYSHVETENVLQGYPHALPRNIDTLLSSQEAAQNESDRRAQLRSVAREVWKVSGFLSSSTVAEGDRITVIYSEFGFEVGRTGTVLSIRKELLFDDVELEVFI
jgi:hypothetical protein